MGKIFNKGFEKEEEKEENKKVGLKKRQKNIEDKREKQLKVLKDQLEKQPIISKVKNPDFNNASFRNLLDDKSMKVFDEIRYQDEITVTHSLILLVHLKSTLLNLQIL